MEKPLPKEKAMVVRVMKNAGSVAKAGHFAEESALHELGGA